MYVTRNITIVIVASTIVFAESDRCPKIKPVSHIDLKDINGTWYEVARYSESSFEKMANGSIITVNIMHNGTIQYKLSNVINGKADGFHGTLSIAPDAKGRGVLLYTAESEAGIHEPDIHLNILALNPKKYLILYDCLYDEKLKKRKELSWISARNPHVHQDIEDAINAFVNSQHVLDKGKLLWERHSDHLAL